MVDGNRVVETVAGGTINAVIKKLAALTIDNVVSPLWEISDSIEWLKEELQILHAVLVDLSHEEHPSEQEKLWKNKMRELAYDIEDAIDSFTLASSNTAQEAVDPSFMERIKNTIKSCTDKIKILPSYYGMATKIERLKQELSYMEDRSKRQKIGGGNGDGSSHDSIPIRDIDAQYAAPADLVGTEGPGNDIVRLLTPEAGSSALPRKVVAIVGFGGLGKTTLAKQVFDKIQGTFDLKAFVTVSGNPDIKAVLVNILDSFGLGNDELQHLRQKGVKRIIDKLREYIEAKRYLVVVDDIWSEDAWTTLNAALFDNNCDGNIIVTTRKDEVATACCSSNCNNHIYRMEPLNPKDSKSLFLNKTFGGRECPPNLERVCHGILKKCAGSPLAILVLSGMLTNKVTVSQWEHVLNTISSEGSGYKVVRRIISLSYFDLPQHLRTCLMCLSIFPEDFDISRKRLVNRWIAEGFVSCIDGISKTETAMQYFGDLISRNLIQPVDIKYDGEARACRVHDTILEFIISKASEENFVSIIGRPLGRSDNKVRRLSIQNYEDAEGLAEEDLSYVRSVTFFGHSPWTVSLRAFTNLRVLDAKDGYPYQRDRAGGHFVDFDVATLPYLKYLDISDSTGDTVFVGDSGSLGDVFIRRVPTGIANLQYLETLDLTCSYLKELPPDVYKLQRLVRLFIDPKIRLPDGIGQMKALEELKRVGIYRDSSLEFLQELGHLTKLKLVSIMIVIGDTSSQQELILVSSLERLSNCNLHSLYLDSIKDASGCDNYHCPVSADSWEAALQGLRKFKLEDQDCHFSKVPAWMATLNDLEKLVLIVKKIDQHGLDILGELKNLLHLCFRAYSPEKRLTFRANKGFRSLKYLRTDVMTLMTFQAGSVPRLEKLVLTIYTGGRILPGDHVSGIEYLDSLTTVSVYIMYTEPDLHGVLTAAKNAITDAVDMLPNKPTLTIDSSPYEKRYSDIDIDEE